MMRFRLPTRRQALLLGVAIFALAVASLVGLGPRWLKGRLEAELASRSGLNAHIGGMQLSAGGVTLDGVKLTDVAGGIEARIGMLEVQGSPLAIAWSGRRGVERVRGRDISGTLDSARLDAAWLSRWQQQRRSTGASVEAAGAAVSARSDAARLPLVDLNAVDLRVRDGRGVLVEVRVEALTRDGEGWRLSAPRARIGEGEDGRVELEGLEVTFSGAGRPRLKSLVLSGARVALPAARVEAEEPDAEGDEASRRTPRIVTRLRALARQLKGPAETDSDASAPDAASEGEAADLLAWLDEEAQLQWKDVQVATAEASAAPALRDVAGRLARDGDAFHATGSAFTVEGGKGSWDVHLWPNEARVQGKVELNQLSLAVITPFLPSVPWYAAEDSRVDVAVTVEAETVERLAINGRLRLTDGAVFHDRIAPAPVQGISLEITGAGRWLPVQRRLEIDAGELTIDKARMQLKGAIEWAKEHYFFDLDAQVPPVACERLLHALPAALLGEVANFGWEGSMHGRLALRLDSRAFDETRLTLEVKDRCSFVQVPMIADVRQFTLPFIHSVVEPDGTIFEMETGPGTPAWTSLSQISPFFVQAVLTHEDRGFFTHHGFSPLHIRNALVRNLKEGRYVVGASTITMQLAKNLFLHREKTLQRKVQEVLLTWWAEHGLAKSEILQLYLNVIEYGPGIYGIRQAARHYFNRTPDALSPAESVFLASILPSPKRYYTQYERRQLSSSMVIKLRRMIERMKERGWYSPEAAAFGLAELDEFRFHPASDTPPLPRVIPGFAEALPYQETLEDPVWEWLSAP